MDVIVNKFSKGLQSPASVCTTHVAPGFTYRPAEGRALGRSGRLNRLICAALHYLKNKDSCSMSNEENNVPGFILTKRRNLKGFSSVPLPTSRVPATRSPARVQQQHGLRTQAQAAGRPRRGVRRVPVPSAARPACPEPVPCGSMSTYGGITGGASSLGKGMERILESSRRFNLIRLLVYVTFKVTNYM